MENRQPNNSVSVCLNAESLSKGRNINGELWLEIAGFDFPGKYWSDFPEIILGWWLEALTKLWSERKRKANCSFMDGPYYFIVERGECGHTLRCYRSRVNTEECQWEGEVNLEALLRQTLKAASLVLTECHKRGWETRETQALTSLWMNVDGVINPASV